MSNEIFVDSSVLIEYRKNNQTDLLDALLSDTSIRLLLSQTVVSEYLFHHLAVFGQKSPLSLKVSHQVSATLAVKAPLPFLNLFSWLPDAAEMLPLSVNFMLNTTCCQTTP